MNAKTSAKNVCSMEHGDNCVFDLGAPASKVLVEPIVVVVVVVVFFFFNPPSFQPSSAIKRAHSARPSFVVVVVVLVRARAERARQSIKLSQKPKIRNSVNFCPIWTFFTSKRIRIRR